MLSYLLILASQQLRSGVQSCSLKKERTDVKASVRKFSEYQLYVVIVDT